MTTNIEKNKLIVDTLKLSIYQNKLFSKLFFKKVQIKNIYKYLYCEHIYTITLHYNNNCDNNMFFDKQLKLFVKDIKNYLQSNFIEIKLFVKTNYFSNGVIFLITLQFEK